MDDMSKVRINKYLRAVLIVFFVALFVQPGHAVTGNGNGTETEAPAEDILSFRTSVTIDEYNMYRYSEIITVKTFEDDYTFIRTLPRRYKGRISNVSVKGYKSYYDENSGDLYIQALEKGRKSFAITYDVEGVNGYGQKKDVFDAYFLNGRECVEGDRIDYAAFRVECSDIVSWERLTIYMGDNSVKLNREDSPTEEAEGLEELSRYGRWTVSESENRVSFISSKPVPADFAVRVHADFPKGFWANATEIGWTKNVSVVMLVLGIIIFIGMRILFGREREISARRGCLPPLAMNPLQTGYLVDGYVDDRDITAQLLYMGERGYMNIREKSRAVFEFEYVRYPDNEDQATKLLFNALFNETSREGDVVSLETASERIRKLVPKIRRKTARVFRGGRAAFTTASKLGNKLIRLAFFVITASLPLMNYQYSRKTYIRLEDGIAVSILFALGLTFLLSRVSIAYMNLHRRQAGGNSLYFKLWTAAYAAFAILYIFLFRFKVDGRVQDVEIVILASLFLFLAPVMLFGFRSMGTRAASLYGDLLGFVEFMKTAEENELADLMDGDEGYFFRILPYAYIFGISKRLASNFQDIDVPAPGWYQPCGCTGDYVFDVVVMNAMLSNFEEAMNQQVFANSAQSRVRR